MTITREQLEAAGFACVLNVCGACVHLGGQHDVWNRCLLCSCPCFSSLDEDEKWERALATLAAAEGKL